MSESNGDGVERAYDIRDVSEADAVASGAVREPAPWRAPENLKGGPTVGVAGVPDRGGAAREEIDAAVAFGVERALRGAVAGASVSSSAAPGVPALPVSGYTPAIVQLVAVAAAVLATSSGALGGPVIVQLVGQVLAVLGVWWVPLLPGKYRARGKVAVALALTVLPFVATLVYAAVADGALTTNNVSVFLVGVTAAIGAGALPSKSINDIKAA